MGTQRKSKVNRGLAGVSNGLIKLLKRTDVSIFAADCLVLIKRFVKLFIKSPFTDSVIATLRAKGKERGFNELSPGKRKVVGLTDGFMNDKGKRGLAAAAVASGITDWIA